MKLVLIAALVAASIAASTASARTSWTRAYVTAYSTTENLTGCYAPGRCRTACGSLLDDRKFTVAANPRLGLRCGQRIRVCGRGCHTATVTDRTASYFTFEFSRALAYATGAPRSAFDSPRYIVWRRA